MKALPFVLLGLVSGCTTPPIVREPDAPEAVFLRDVPFVAQTRNHCGPASLAMMLAWQGEKVSADSLADKMYSPESEGTLPLDVLGVVRRKGYLAIPVKTFPALFREIAAGNPVMVLENLGRSWLPRWHYAVVTGYDLAAEEVSLHSGSDRHDTDGIARFARAWGRAENWGIVLLEPGEISPSGDELAHLEAVVALERLGRLRLAEKGYRAILANWPESIGAAIGLGNVSYQLGMAARAALLLKSAVIRHPDSAVLWHNLAVAQGTAGQHREAADSALKALTLATPEDRIEFLPALRPLLKKGD